MKDNELTLALDGEVTLRDFSKAMLRFREMVEALEKEVDPKAKIDWVIDNLQKKCAIASVRGIPVTPKDRSTIKRVRSEFIEIGRRVVHGETLSNYAPVIQAVTGLRKLINGRITSIRFETTEKRYVIKKQTVFAPTESYWHTDTFGGARGRIQSISDRQFLHFTLYEYDDDHAITCSFPKDTTQVARKEEMRNLWGKMAYVQGIVTRDEQTDLLKSIQDISSINVIDERQPKEWREAQGCAR